MYEIGDDVIYQGADKSAYKRRGVVASIEEKDGKPQLTVAFGDGEEFTAPIDDWSRAFTNAAKNGVSPEMRMAVKLRLKQDFKDDYGSYRKGDVFWVYQQGGFNPHHATLRVPGRQVTLEVPWDKVELVNSRAKNAKLKVGDEVKSKTFGKTFIERVIRVYPKARGLGYPPGRTENNFDWYETDHAGIFSENEVGVGKAHVPVSANSRSCNSTNPNVRNAINASAKIVTTGNFGTLKVGDRVDFRKSRYWRGTGVVTKVYGDGIIDVKGDNGEGEMEIHEEDIMNSRVRTTNATVRNALNTRTAKNAETGKEFYNKIVLPVNALIASFSDVVQTANRYTEGLRIKPQINEVRSAIEKLKDSLAELRG